MPAERRGAVRVTYVLTHPIQYFAPWFKQISSDAREIDLTVVYVTKASDEKRGAGFARPVDWGRPLLDGYRSRIVCETAEHDEVRTHAFWSLVRAKVGSAIAATRPDVVVIPGWHSAAYIRALLWCRLNRVPALYRGDTHLGNAPPGLRGLVWRVKNRLLLRLFDRYLAVGTRAREFLAAHGVSDARIVSCPHAVDNDFFAANAAPFQRHSDRRDARRLFGLPVDAFVISVVGKVDSNKRPLDIIRTAARLGDVAVLLVGGGPLEEACWREAERAGVPIACTGFLDQPSLGRAYAAADCLVLASECETWGLVVNEALATGLPCIVSSGVGCAPDLIQTPLVGSVYPVGDLRALAAAVRDMRARRERSTTDVALACRAAAANVRFERATAGLVDASRAAARGRPERPVPAEATRILVCGGGMVTMGGSERVVFEIVRLARERGAAVHVLVNDWGASTIVRAADACGATWSHTWIRAPLRRSRLTPIGVAGYAIEFARTSASLLRAAARFRPTSVLVLDYTSALRNCFGLIALRLLRVPVVVKLANAPESGRFYRRLWRWLVNPLGSVFVCNSKFTERELLACGIPRSKVVTIYNTTPVRSKASAEKIVAAPDRVIYVGQLIPEKGVERLFDAVALLRQRGVRVTLDVVGEMDGWAPAEYVEFRNRLRARAAAAPLEGAVRLLGWREDVASCFASAAVHCCPSLPAIREAFGLVVLEAKSASIPSVVSRSGALPELVTHQIDGWICDDTSAEALAEGLEYFLADDRRRVEAGRQASASLARFDRRTFADTWWGLVSAEPHLPRGQVAVSEMR